MRTMIAFIVSGLLLAACGGGGGGATTSAPETPQTPTITLPDTVSTYRRLLTEFSERLLFGQAARPPVRYTNPTGLVLSTAPATTAFGSTFDGERGTFIVQRGSSESVTLDTDDAYADDGAQPSAFGLPGRTSRTRTTFSHTGSSATHGVLTVDWDDTNPNSYVAGGYWAHYDGSSAIPQIGVFVDGAELSITNPATLPISGTAAYRGAAGGLYALRDTTTIAAGDFQAIATLSADFGERTISGCVGCAGGIFLTGTSHTGGVATPFSDVATPFKIYLRAAPIATNGSFIGGDVLLDHPGNLITVTNGLWGGVFSNVPDESGDPRLLAGAFAAESGTPGVHATFAGAFAAGKQ